MSTKMVSDDLSATDIRRWQSGAGKVCNSLNSAQWTGRLVVHGEKGQCSLIVRDGDLCVENGSIRASDGIVIDNTLVHSFSDWRQYNLLVVPDDEATVTLVCLFHARFWTLNSTVSVDVNFEVELADEHNRQSFRVTLPPGCDSVVRSARASVLLEHRSDASDATLVQGLLIVAPTDDSGPARLYVFSPHLRAGRWHVAGQLQFEKTENS